VLLFHVIKKNTSHRMLYCEHRHTVNNNMKQCCSKYNLGLIVMLFSEAVCALLKKS
jgi:hypothetical protein